MKFAQGAPQGWGQGTWGTIHQSYKYRPPCSVALRWAAAGAGRREGVSYHLADPFHSIPPTLLFMEPYPSACLVACLPAYLPAYSCIPRTRYFSLLTEFSTSFPPLREATSPLINFELQVNEAGGREGEREGLGRLELASKRQSRRRRRRRRSEQVLITKELSGFQGERRARLMKGREIMCLASCLHYQAVKRLEADWQKNRLKKKKTLGYQRAAGGEIFFSTHYHSEMLHRKKTVHAGY
ncbi:hypothetical protein E2C01_033951 [Portunus trituberculatus]|uniref:Uncharacterized protein n=1 Tax=Portunus trituberculatus TaxID=210409 RepID=A0A5B7F454_PORTR|nr:hypothetical protein [Portunus trituberculatus]